MFARDVYAFDKSTRTRSPEGFLIADAAIAKVGVQTYSRRELGMKGTGVLKLWRPAEEVHAADALASFENKPVTDRHPPEGVITAKNWSRLARGEVRDVHSDGEHVRAKVIVKDAALIKKIDEGTAELSCGYDFTLDLTAGTTPTGEQYHGIMRNLRGNHVAAVDQGRAGHTCRIEDGARTMKIIVVDGVSHTVEDDTIADVLNKALGERDASRKACDSAAESLAKLTAEKTVTDAKIKELEVLAAPEHVAAVARDLVRAEAHAKALDAKFVSDGKDADTIRREALALVKDAPRVAVRDAVLGGIERAKATGDVLRRALDAVSAATSVTTTKVADHALAAALSGGSATKQYGVGRVATDEEITAKRKAKK